jgi:hypothetical protein
MSWAADHPLLRHIAASRFRSHYLPRIDCFALMPTLLFARDAKARTSSFKILWPLIDWLED